MPLRDSFVNMLPAPALSAARTLRWRAAKARSEMLASIPSELDARASLRAPAFIVGSGRSGTTALGKALSMSPALSYYFEPVDRWFAVSPATDYGGLFSARSGHCVLDERVVDDALRIRFRRVFRGALSGESQLVEKTPINALRIGFLEAIDPRAKFIEIRRDGTDVVRSIMQLSRKHDYNLLGRDRANRWWGPDDCKWRSLSAELRDFEIEPEYLVPDAEFATRAAIEWIASVKAVERAAARLGPRLYRVNHSDLLARPEETVAGVAAFLGIPEGDWLLRAGEHLRGARRRTRLPVVLPGPIAQRMNKWNERLGFAGRAIEGPHLSGFTTECQTTSDDHA
jgi:hypothetical protein